MIEGTGNSAFRAAGLGVPLPQNTCAGTGDLPSFFIVGPPRTGTTWLHGVLKKYAQLPASIKETRFFDKHFHEGFAWYRAHYGRRVPGRCLGEVAPTYFISAAARERIARSVPSAKVVCIFRNPVERVLSLYRLKRAYGLIPWSLEDAMVRDPELGESSRYASNFRAWQTAVRPQHVMACVYDDLRENPQFFVNQIADFIGVPRFILTASEIAYVESSGGMTHPRSYYRTRSAMLMANWLKARRFGSLVATVKNSPMRRFLLGGGAPFPEISVEFLRKLYEMFRGEVEQLEELLHRDLSTWKSLSPCPSANHSDA